MPECMETDRAINSTKGVSYIRTVREPTEILYSPEEEFPIGGSKVFAYRTPH